MVLLVNSCQSRYAARTKKLDRYGPHPTLLGYWKHFTITSYEVWDTEKNQVVCICSTADKAAELAQKHNKLGIQSFQHQLVAAQ